MFLSSELMKEQKHKLFYSCNHEAAEHSLTSWDNKHPVNKIMFSYLTVKFVSKYFWNDTNFPQLIISKYQNKWNACYNNVRDKTREAETMQQVLPHCTSCFLWHGHVFPPPQSAHGLTLSQTNWSFLCEYRTFNPSETWHAVLSSMNASLLDLSLCCVLGGQQGDVLHPAGWRPPLDAAPSLTRPGEELVRHPRTVTVTTLCFCLFTNADYNLCFISCITEFSWICWHCTGGGGGGWCCMPLHSYLGLFV